MLILKNFAIINKILLKKILYYQVMKVISIFVLIKLFSKLVLKHNSSFYKIFHLLSIHGKLVNNHILDKIKNLRYTKF